MKGFQPSRLFEPWELDRGRYPSFEADLDAVRAGTKGMSMFHRADHRDVVRLAFDRDLLVVLQRERVFVARAEDLWRIPAYLALWETAFENGAWTDAAEAQASLLLGYTKAERAAWLAHQRYQHAAWGAPTIYTLLTRAQREVVRSLGHRCFAPEADLVGMTFLCNRGGTLKREAHRLVPKGLTLARAGLARTAFDALFGAKRVAATVTRKQAASIQAGLASRVEVLTRSGWR